LDADHPSTGVNLPRRNTPWEDGHECPEFADCPCPEPRRHATHRIEIRHCEDRRKEAETVFCRASEEWPELYCGVFGMEIELGGKRRHAEIDIRFDDGAPEVGPVFLLCRYRTDECARAHPEMFSDPVSWTDRPSRLNRPSSLLGVAEDEQRRAMADLPVGKRANPLAAVDSARR
jgi:hypothetical protein